MGVCFKARDLLVATPVALQVILIGVLVVCRVTAFISTQVRVVDVVVRALTLTPLDTTTDIN
jgi:hypothetical protein